MGSVVRALGGRGVELELMHMSEPPTTGRMLATCGGRGSGAPDGRAGHAAPLTMVPHSHPAGRMVLVVEEEVVVGQLGALALPAVVWPQFPGELLELL